MNYKLMQRPMFRLGGNVRQNYSRGTPFSEQLKGKSTQELLDMQAQVKISEIINASN